MTTRTIALAWLLAASSVVCTDAAAEWPVEGHVMPTGGGVSAGQMIPDGAGGVIIASPQDGPLMVEQIDGSGNRREIHRGPAVFSSAFRLVSDGVSGFYLTWVSGEPEDHDVYLARHSTTGEEIWRQRIHDSSIDQRPYLGNLVAGDAGGVYVSVRESWSAGSMSVTRLLGDGTIQGAWPIFVPSGWMTAAGTGGFVASYSSGEGSDPDSLHLARFDSTATQVWKWKEPRASQSGWDIEPDGHGGLYVAWRAPESGARLVRLGMNGDPAPNWSADGVAVGCDGRASGVSICTDGAGGVYLVWPEVAEDTFNDLHAQHVRGDGTIAPGWPACGRNLTDKAARNQDDADCIPDGSGGVIIAWQDWRYQRWLGSAEPFVVRLAADGSVVPGWSPGGMSLASPADVYSVVAVPDGTGGAVIGWTDSHYQEPGHVQRVRGDGTYGPLLARTPEPSLRLFNAWPNPFGSRVAFKIELSRPQRLSVAVRDVMGRRVLTLKHPDHHHAGPHTIVWRGQEQSGSPAPPGMYFIDVHTDSSRQTRRVVKLRPQGTPQ